MLYLTRKEHFNAAHRLFNPAWSEERNMEVFGKCSNKNWHGHNYYIFVTVKGNPDPDTGFVMHATTLSNIIKKEVLERFDHKNLNMDIPYFSKVQPSSENFVKLIWDILKTHITECALHSIKLQETENIYTEYFGE